MKKILSIMMLIFLSSMIAKKSYSIKINRISSRIIKMIIHKELIKNKKYKKILNINIIISLIRCESNNDASALEDLTRNGGSWGLMQISHLTAKDRGFRGIPEFLHNPTLNIKYGLKQLHWLSKRKVKGKKITVRQTLDAWNRGITGIRRYPNRNKKYVNKILKQIIKKGEE